MILQKNLEIIKLYTYPFDISHGSPYYLKRPYNVRSVKSKHRKYPPIHYYHLCFLN